MWVVWVEPVGTAYEYFCSSISTGSGTLPHPTSLLSHEAVLLGPTMMSKVSKASSYRDLDRGHRDDIVSHRIVSLPESRAPPRRW